MEVAQGMEGQAVLNSAQPRLSSDVCSFAYYHAGSDGCGCGYYGGMAARRMSTGDNGGLFGSADWVCFTDKQILHSILRFQLSFTDCSDNHCGS